MSGAFWLRTQTRVVAVELLGRTEKKTKNVAKSPRG